MMKNILMKLHKCIFNFIEIKNNKPPNFNSTDNIQRYTSFHNKLMEKTAEHWKLLKISRIKFSQWKEIFMTTTNHWKNSGKISSTKKENQPITILEWILSVYGVEYDIERILVQYDERILLLCRKRQRRQWKERKIKKRKKNQLYSWVPNKHFFKQRLHSMWRNFQ